ncbi:MAG: type II secretion system protein GspN [Candidatus Binatia bacterium]
MRILLFLAAFVFAVLATAPLDRWILDRVREPLARAGIELEVASLRLALPAGVRATRVAVETEQAGILVDSLYVGITRFFDAEACGGRVSGSVTREGAISVRLEGVDPSRCVRVGQLALETPLDGEFELDGLAWSQPTLAGDTRARIRLRSQGGVFRGVLQGAGPEGSDLPLGEWEFEELVLSAVLENRELEVEEGHALTSGVEWQLVSVKLPEDLSRGGLRVDFRAREVEEGPRSRALIGLMPRSAADADGWHNYRVTGSIASPRVIGVN